MADNDNTEQLKLDTSQPNAAIDQLMQRIRQMRAELNKAPGSTPGTNSGFSNAAIGRVSAPGGNIGSSIGQLQSTLTNFVNALNAQVRTMQTAASINQGASANSNSRRFGVQGSLLANYAVLGAGIGGITGTVREVVQLDNALHNIQAITRSSDASMVSLRTDIISVASASKFMSSEVANAAVTLGQAGLSASQIGDALKSVVNLAAAAGADLSQAVNIITGAMGAFNLNAGEAEKVANLFTAALNNSKLTMDQLTQGFTYSANSAAQLGVGFEELTTILAALSNAGIKSGSTLGTNLRSLFVDLQDPTEKLQATLGRLGLSLDDIDVKSKSVTTVIRNLHDAGFTAADAFQTLQTRSASAFVALVGQLDTINELHQGLIGTSAASAAAATQMGSLANTAKNTASIFTGLAATSLQPMVDGSQKLLTVFNGILKSATALGPVLAGIGTLIASMAASSGLRFLFGLLTGGAATGGVVAALGGPIGIGITATIAAVAGLAYVLGQAKNKTDEFAGATEEAKGKSEAAATSYQEVQQSIVSLLTKEQSLRDLYNGDLKTTTIELGERFRALGLDVTGLEGNFDGLLGKLRELSGEQRNAMKGSLELLAARQKSELDNLKGTSGAVTARARGFVSSGDITTRESTNTGVSSDYGAFKSPRIQQYLARLRSGRPLDGSDFQLIQGALADLKNLGPDTSPQLYSSLSQSLETALGFSATLATKQNQQSITQAGLASVSSQGSTAFQSLEETAQRFYQELNGGKPKGDLNDPLGTQNRLSSYLAKHKPEFDAIQKGYTDYAGSDPSRQAAVSSSASRQQLAGLQDELEGKLANVHDSAQKIAGIIAEFTARQVENQLRNLDKELEQAKNFDEVDAVAAKINGLMPTLFAKQADEFARKQLGLDNSQYSIDSKNFRINLDKSVRDPSARLQADAFSSNFVEAFPQSQAQQVKAKQDQITKKVYDSNLGALELQASAYDRTLRDSFKNVTEYTPASQIEKLAADALDTLVQWYQTQLDIIEQKVVSSNLNQEDADKLRQSLLGSLNDQYASRTAETTDHTKNLPYDYSRGATSYDEAFSNIGKATTDPRYAQEGVNEFATTFQDTMIAAVGNVKGSFGGLWTNIVNGSQTAGGAFKQFAVGILNSMTTVIGNRIAGQFINLFGSLLPGAGIGGGGGTDVLSSGGGDDFLTGSQGLYVKRMAGGGSVGTGIGTRDQHMAMLEEGEFVLRNSAVSAIGRDNLEMLNSMGGNHVSKAKVPTYKPGAPGMTNVYVVQPNRVPQMSKSDVLITISDDILQGGATKKLIKSVMNGA